MKTVIERMQEAGIHTYPVSVPISADHMKLIEWTVGLLCDVTGREECFCPPSDECSLDHPKCDYRELLAAKECLQQIIQPVHRSLNPDRMASYPEAIYLRRWVEEQVRHKNYNGGYGLLEMILSPTRGPKDRWNVGTPEYMPPVSQRDAEVAATVIQWLGTNCGRCFMDAAEKEIGDARKDSKQLEYELHANRWQGRRAIPRDEVLANEVAGHFLKADDPNFSDLSRQIVAAIEAGRTVCEASGAT